MGLIHGRKTVTLAGSPERLTTTSYSGPVTIAITAEEDNTGDVVIGGSAAVDETAASRTGLLLVAGATAVLRCNPADVWLDVGVNTDGVTYLIQTA